MIDPRLHERFTNLLMDTVNSAISAANASTVLTIAGAGNTTLGGAISDGSGSLGLIVNGTGVVTLSAANSFSGGTTVQSGTLTLSSSGTLGGGSLMLAPAASNQSAIVNVGSSTQINNLSETAGSLGSVQFNVLANASVTLNQTASANFGGPISLGSNASLRVQQGASDTLAVAAAPSLASGSTLTVASGTLAFTPTSGSATIGSNVNVSIVSGATLQLAGSTSNLSQGSTVATVSNSGNLLVSGATNQVVDAVSGTATNGSQTTYTGNTVVGSVDGSTAGNLSATQILQNTLTINAGSTVTIAPAGSETEAQPAEQGTGTDAATLTRSVSEDGASDAAPASSSASDPFTAIQAAIASGSITSTAGQRLESRIAAIEALATNDPGLDASLLESGVLAVIPPSSASSSAEASPMADASSSLLALDSGAIGSGSTSVAASPTFAPSASFAGSPATVPEPASLLLAILAGVGLLIGSRRRKHLGDCNCSRTFAA